MAALNAEARAGAVRETLFGVTLQDPYRALESDSELTRRWMRSQTEHTQQELARHRDPSVEQRLRELLSIGSIDEGALAGDALYITLREGERERSALHRIHKGKPSEPALIDPLRFSAQAALDWSYPSRGGRYIAFGISEQGDERSTLRIVDTASGALLADRIDHAKWCNLSWLNDDSGFYYTRYPRPGEPRHDPEQEDSYFPGVFFHRLGSDPSNDPLVWQSQEGSDFPSPGVGDRDDQLLVMNFRGWTASDLYLLARTPQGSWGPARPVVQGRDSITTGSLHRGKLLLYTTEQAPRGRIVQVAPEQAADRSAWRDLVPEGSGVIESWVALRDRLVVHRIQDIHSQLHVVDLEGQPLGQVELPTQGAVEALQGPADGSAASFVFSSFFHPPTLYKLDAVSLKARVAYQVQHDVDTSAFRLSRERVRSADGTAVNVFYVHRANMVRDGNNPVLLYGYGGFNVSLLPDFTRTALHWLERGGVYAVANLRGGGEEGDAWHRAGMLEHKPRVFEDFEAVTAWFSDSRISRPERIAISGGSNGGLLVGAMITRAPQRFAAAATYVGLYDMLRYHLFPPAQLWISEYGDPREAQDAAYLRAYSPYHQVRDGVTYPSVLVETADHDTRVHWGHSTKFAARLQEASGGTAPIYFHLERQVGHGRGTRLSDLVARYARKQAFLEAALGMGSTQRNEPELSDPGSGE